MAFKDTRQPDIQLDDAAMGLESPERNSHDGFITDMSPTPSHGQFGNKRTSKSASPPPAQQQARQGSSRLRHLLTSAFSFSSSRHSPQVADDGQFTLPQSKHVGAHKNLKLSDGVGSRHAVAEGRHSPNKLAHSVSLGLKTLTMGFPQPLHIKRGSSEPKATVANEKSSTLACAATESTSVPPIDTGSIEPPSVPGSADSSPTAGLSARTLGHGNGNLGLHQTNIPSPLASAEKKVSLFTQTPSTTTSSTESSPPPENLATIVSEPEPEPEEEEEPGTGTGTSWSLHDVINITKPLKSLTRDNTSSSPLASPSRLHLLSSPSYFSRSSTAAQTAATENSRHCKKVDALISELMSVPDRRESGFIDASRMRRKLGIGPKRKEKCDLYYEVFGTGEKKLFLIMGMIGSTMYWRLQTRYFSHLGDYTICVFDNCGSGKSTIAPGPYRISQMAKDAQLVLDHLGWKDDIHVVGVSLGGMIAQELCLLNSKCETGVENGTAAGGQHTPDVDAEDRNSPPRFASVTLVDTWHSSALAVPTAKEVKFSFNGMSALGSNPKHLIDLVFSRDWINKPFRDPVKTAEQGFSGEDDDDIKLTNREVLSRLFKAIQLDLNLHRMSMNEQPHALTPSPANDTSQIDPENTPMARKASTPQPQTRPKVAPNPLKGSERQTSDLGWSSEAPHMHHSISAAAVATLQHLEQAASPEIAHALPGHSGNNSSESLAGTPPTPSRENSYSTRSDYSIPSMTVGTKREVSGDLHQFMACLGHRLTSQRVRAIRKLNPRTRFLVIHGEKDRVIRPICGRTLAKLLGCPIVWIEGAGHMPLIDAHCTFNLIVRAFTREEKWIEELPDRTCITPASWEEQVRVRRWIMNPTRSASGDSGKEISLNVQDSNNSGPEHIRLACASSPPQPEETPTFEQATAQERQDRRTSRISYIKPVGPLAHELFFVDENDASLGGKFIPANSEDHQKQATAQQAEADAHRLRELIICGSLLDAPLRLRRYSLKTDRTVI